MKSSSVHRSIWLWLSLALAVISWTGIAASQASASKQVVDYFGSESGFGSKGGDMRFPSAVAINESSAGAGNPGDVYVADDLNDRIERFGRNGNGTDGNVSDDSYFFISAWGADVDSTPSGGSNYEICTVAAECKEGVPSGGNGTAAGNGSLDNPTGIAVDQDTGLVYVTDADNFRVNVYDGDGAFLRSFGYDVVASGPDDVVGPAERQQLTIKASGGRFSLFFDGRTTGAVGTAWRPGAGVTTLTQIAPQEGAFSVGQGISGEGIAPETTITGLGPGTLTISKPTTEATTSKEPLFGDNFAPDVSAAAIEAGLNGLPSIGGVGGSVTVSGGPGDEAGSSPYMIDFGGALADDDVQQIQPTTGGLTLGGGKGLAQVTEVIRGGAYEVCQETSGDVCKGGSAGSGTGEFGEPGFQSDAGTLAVSPSDGNTDSGLLIVGDPNNRRINTYALDGSSPASVGEGVFGKDSPVNVTIDSRGIIYATNRLGNSVFKIERYDSQNANGDGVGFMAPISRSVLVEGGKADPTGSDPYEVIFSGSLGHQDVSQLKVENGAVPLSGGTGGSVVTATPGGPGSDEVQQVKIAATAGQFKLNFNGQSTGAAGTGTTNSATKVVTNVATTSGHFVVGEALSGTNIPPDARISNVDTAAHTIEFTSTSNATGSGQVSNLTADLAFDTSELTMQNALAALTSIPASPSFPTLATGLAVDPDADGGGADKDVLYMRASQVTQLGPINDPGLPAPPTLADDVHGTSPTLQQAQGLAIEQATGRIYLPGEQLDGQAESHGVYVLGEVGAPPTATLDSVDAVTATTATVHATVNPNGPPALSYHLEYSTDGIEWKTTTSVKLGAQESPQLVSAVLDPPGTGLLPSTLYHVRLVAVRPFFPPVFTGEKIFTTLSGAPSAETVGSPLRTATTARLEGRVNPRNSSTAYRFEFGTGGPCDATPCESTEAHAAGSGGEIKLVSQFVDGLQPNTTYHYRVVAEGGGSGSPVFGDDMTLTTRQSDAPLGHGHLPGPAGSDRAYEQVSLPDTSGNPVNASVGFSADGNRAIYGVAGGTPSSDVGSLANLLFAERTPGGWQSRQISPSRDELTGRIWDQPLAPSDLSTLFAPNFEELGGDATFWRMSPNAGSVKLLDLSPVQVSGERYGLSADGTLAVALLKGPSLDGSHPEAASQDNLYDISSGPPRLISLLPGNVVGACGVPGGVGDADLPPQTAHWVAPDGSRVFFPSRGVSCSESTQLYLREVQDEQTKLISGPPISGLRCGAVLLRATPTAAFFKTQSRLASQDTTPSSCGGDDNSDVYGYDLGDGNLTCISCVVPGTDADVASAAVADDGSRVYIQTDVRLLAGAASSGAYRIDVATRGLAYLGPEVPVGQSGSLGFALTPSGSVFTFYSDAPALNPLGGVGNDGSAQYYRYDDRDRSLVCLSCPATGSAPGNDVPRALVKLDLPELGLTALSADGETFVFRTPNSLLSADQNTPGGAENPESGEDVYEWRDGRLFLITDGLTNWAPKSQPVVAGISPTGRDIYFTAAAQYTPDALDGYNRLYDARIGGGFEFPQPPKPCPLEVCQGTPKGPPEQRMPGTVSFAGVGNAKPAAAKRRKARKHKPKTRHHKKRGHKHPRNHHRRAHR